MKRSLSVLFSSILFLSAATAAIAQPEGQGMGGSGMQQGMGGQGMGQGMGGQGMGKGMMGGQGGEMGQGMMCPMCSSMMKSVASPQVISTGDGGFVILTGNKLIKYDKDLNVVKEADIKVDVSAMMEKMKADCPVCKMMKEKKEEMKEKMKEKKEENK